MDACAATIRSIRRRATLTGATDFAATAPAQPLLLARERRDLLWEGSEQTRTGEHDPKDGQGLALGQASGERGSVHQTGAHLRPSSSV